MKTFSIIATLLALLFSRSVATATTINWTNTAGGNWTDAINWSPNQIPSSGDTASITANGTYEVTLDATTSVGSLVIGGASGAQTLSTSTFDLSVSGSATINTKGVLNVQGGVFDGGSVSVKGNLNWINGRFGPNIQVNVATNGVMTQIGFGSYSEFGGVLTNAGTVNMTSGIWRSIQWSSYSGGSGLVVNQSTGLINLSSNVNLASYQDGSSTLPTPKLINQGTLRRSGPTDTNTLQIQLINSGTVDVQTGYVVLTAGGTNTGTFSTTSGTTIEFQTDYDAGGSLTGAGHYLVTSGLFSFKSTLSSYMTWTGGRFETNSVGTITSTGTLDVSGGNGYYEMEGIITNAGTIHVQNAILRCIAYAGYSGGYGLIVNQAGALIDLTTNATFDAYDDGTGAGHPLCINNGTIRKSSAIDTTAINIPMINSGTIDVQTGTVSIAGGGSGNGAFIAEAGTTLDFALKDFHVDSSLTGAGTNTFNLNFSLFGLNGSLNTSNSVLLSGFFGGTNGVINSRMSWTGGLVGPNATLTIGSNAALTVNTSGYAEMLGVLTNNGTISIASGYLRLIDYSGYGGGYGLLVNRGTFDITADVVVDVYNDNSGTGAPTFINRGVLRRSGSMGAAYFNPPLINTGTIDAESGQLTFSSASIDLTGGTINFGISSLTNFGTIAFAQAPAFTGTLSATLNNGYVPIAPNAFTVISSYPGQTGLFTATNLPFADAWQTTYDPTSLTITVLNARPSVVAPTNSTVDELTLLSVTATATDPDIPAQTKTFSLVSPPTGMNIGASSGTITWTPQQTQSPGTNLITVVVTDNGTPALSATNTFTVIVREVNYAPSLPTIAQQSVNELNLFTIANTATNFNIHSTNYGYGLINPPANMTISATGVINWTPAQTQSPSTNTITTVVTNGNPYDLIHPRLTSTNSFTLVVKEVNVAPGMAAIAQQTVNELTQLSVNSPATNFNIHSTNYGYGLLNAPAGMNVNASGTVTWTPSQNQSPSTNTVSVIATNGNPYDLINPRLIGTNTFTVVVKEVNVAPSLQTIAQQTVNELTLLSVTNAATNANIHSTNFGYGLINPPAGMTINSSGVISWTPQQTQSPSTNTITTVVTNGNPYDLVNPRLTSTNSFTVVVKEVNVAPSLQTIAQQTVNELTLLTVTNAATNANIHSTNFGYGLINPPANMTIDANGVISWIPQQNQSPSTNTVTTVVTNGNPYDAVNPRLTSTNSFTVVVKEVNVSPTLPGIPAQKVNAQSLLTVTNTATESNIHATLGYTLTTAPVGATIDANGIITWTPPRSAGPSTNTITTVVTNTDVYDTVNPHLSATNTFFVIVYAPTLNPITDKTVNPGQTVSFTATATDNDSSRVLSFSLGTAPAGASITSNGQFTWRPGIALANTTNSVQVIVNDNSTPSLSDGKSFNVIVGGLQPVTLTPSGYASSQFSMTVTGTSGPDYIISASGNLTNWTDISTNANATTPFIFTDLPNAGTPRFYRIHLGP